MTIEECEKKGIKTVLLTAEYGGKNGTELPLVYYSPLADSMISLGSFERGITVPSPEKVIGLQDDELISLNPTDPPFSPWKRQTLEVYNFTSGIDWFGNTHNTCKEY